jgi:hypothetical protein
MVPSLSIELKDLTAIVLTIEISLVDTIKWTFRPKYQASIFSHNLTSPLAHIRGPDVCNPRCLSPLKLIVHAQLREDLV